jgi:hypothetical protein
LCDSEGIHQGRRCADHKLSLDKSRTRADTSKGCRIFSVQRVCVAAPLTRHDLTPTSLAHLARRRNIFIASDPINPRSIVGTILSRTHDTRTAGRAAHLRYRQENKKPADLSAGFSLLQVSTMRRHKDYYKTWDMEGSRNGPARGYSYAGS